MEISVWGVFRLESRRELGGLMNGRIISMHVFAATLLCHEFTIALNSTTLGNYSLV